MSVVESSMKPSTKSVEKIKLVGAAVPLQSVSHPTILSPSRPKGVVIQELVNTTYSRLDIRNSLTF